MRRVLTMLMLIVPSLAAADIPLWPYRDDPDVTRVLDQLESVTVRLKIDDWTLTRVIGELRGNARLMCRPDFSVDPRQERVTLTLARALSLRQVLNLICQGKPWTWAVHEKQVVFTRHPERYANVKAAQIRARIERARLVPGMWGNLIAVQDRTESIERRIKTGRIQHPRLELSGASLTARLPGLIGVPVELQRKLQPQGHVSLPARGQVVLSEFLQKALRPLDLGWVAYRGKLWIGTPKGVREHTKLAVQAKSLVDDFLAKHDALMARKVTLDVKGVALHAVAAPLAKALEMEVLIGQLAWAERTLLELTVADRPLAEVVKALETQLGGRVQVIYDLEALYVVRRPSR